MPLYVGTRYSLLGSGGVAAAGGSGNWVTTFTAALSGNSAGWNGFNLRFVIPASQLSQSGTKFRLTLDGAASGVENLQIDSIYAGHAAGAGDAYDFDGTQVQVLVATISSFTIASGGQQLTDENVYAFDEAKNFIIAAHFNNASHDITKNVAGTGAAYYFKSAASEVATTDVTGYTAQANASILCSKIEVFQ